LAEHSPIQLALDGEKADDYVVCVWRGDLGNAASTAVENPVNLWGQMGKCAEW